jgi:histidinol dehydrogenase
MINRLSTVDADFAARFADLTARPDDRDPSLSATVAGIIDAVRVRGDAALVEMTQRFDGRTIDSVDDLALPAQALEEALQALPPAQREALETAAGRIRDYHQRQLQGSWDFTDELGNRLGQRVTPLARAGLYVPGGKASYPSSVLMNAIPARVAGVREVVMMVPAPGGQLNPLVLAAAAVAGVDRVFTAGGAQAVAALAFGTATVPRVDKIVGPGNRFVAEAKRQLFGVVGIDMVAGPSEILILADGSVDPAWVAMDLFSQAEHDEQAQAILISPDGDYLDRVRDAIEAALPTLPRGDVIRASLADRGALIKTATLEEAVALSNRIGPEHLELALAGAPQWLERIDVAGAIFVGSMSSESLGDYCAGPNHVLPTSGTARFSSPLGVYDFQKRSSVIHCSPQGAATLGVTAALLARGEGLEAHARSAELRRDPDSAG